MHEHPGGFDTPPHRTVQLRLRVLVLEPLPDHDGTRACRRERKRGAARGRRRRSSPEARRSPTTWQPLPRRWMPRPLFRSYSFSCAVKGSRRPGVKLRLTGHRSRSHLRGRSGFSSPASRRPVDYEGACLHRPAPSPSPTRTTLELRRRSSRTKSRQRCAPSLASTPADDPCTDPTRLQAA